MDEQTRLLETVVGQIDKRLSSIEQHMVGFHAAIEHVREEVGRVRGELGNKMDQIRSELRGEIVAVRVELKADMAEMRSEVREEIRHVRGELGQMRGEMEAIRAEGRSHLRWSLTGMFTLFGAAGPLWMWVLSRIVK